MVFPHLVVESLGIALFISLMVIHLVIHCLVIISCFVIFLYLNLVFCGFFDHCFF